MMERVTVVGAGLAGCEACWQLVTRGIPVRLIEMRPKKQSPAHHSDRFAELVCSNSLRSDSLQNAVGKYFNRSYLSVLSMFVEEKKITPEEIKELIRQVEAGSQNEKP